MFQIVILTISCIFYSGVEVLIN